MTNRSLSTCRTRIRTWCNPVTTQRCTRLLALLVVLIPVCPSLAAGLKPFSSDGCSAFPDGTPAQQTLWLQCCHQHDLAYWKGGTYEERLAADRALRSCVSQVGEPAIAALMLAGVRIGGTPYLPTRFRWGYGWPWPRGYRPLTQDEQAEVSAALELLP